jgi:hypothetical protein
MYGFVVVILFHPLRAVFRRDTEQSANPDAAELNRRANQASAEGNRSLEEHTVLALIKKAEREAGTNSVEVGIYLRNYLTPPTLSERRCYAY